MVYLNAHTISQSIYHWLIECPQRVEDDTEEKQVKLTLCNDELYNCYIGRIVDETLDHAALNSECTRTVCGLSGLDNYLETLSPEDREKVEEKQSETKFRFGDGGTVASSKSAIIPAHIGNSDFTTQKYVISNELLLPWSKVAMKEEKSKTDFTNDKIF